jgi:hypothetical protein
MPELPFRIAPTFTATRPHGLKVPAVTPMCSSGRWEVRGLDFSA